MCFQKKHHSVTSEKHFQTFHWDMTFWFREVSAYSFNNLHIYFLFKFYRKQSRPKRDHEFVLLHFRVDRAFCTFRKLWNSLCSSSEEFRWVEIPGWPWFFSLLDDSSTVPKYWKAQNTTKNRGGNIFSIPKRIALQSHSYWQWQNLNLFSHENRIGIHPRSLRASKCWSLTGLPHSWMEFNRIAWRL